MRPTSIPLPLAIGKWIMQASAEVGQHAPVELPYETRGLFLPVEEQGFTDREIRSQPDSLRVMAALHRECTYVAQYARLSQHGQLTSAAQHAVTRLRQLVQLQTQGYAAHVREDPRVILDTGLVLFSAALKHHETQGPEIGGTMLGLYQRWTNALCDPDPRASRAEMEGVLAGCRQILEA